MNNCVYLMLLLFTVALSHATTRNQLEKGLLKIIEKWKKGNVRSLPIALPALPLEQAPFEFEYDGYKLSVHESKIWGLENMSVQRLTASNLDLTTSIIFNIPVLAALSDWYHFQGEYVFRIDNQGTFSLDLNTIQVAARLEFESQGSNTVIKKIDLDYTVDNVEVNLSECNFFVLMEVNRKLREMVSQKDQFLIDEMKKQIINTTNSLLQGYTPIQLIKIISSV